MAGPEASSPPRGFSPLWAPGDLELAREVYRLKEERGLGYRRIAKLLRIHYKKAERLYKKYRDLLTSVKVTGGVDGVTLRGLCCHMNPKTRGSLRRQSVIGGIGWALLRGLSSESCSLIPLSGGL